MALKIMIVDDDPDVLKLIKTFVEPLGVEVLTVADSREAAKRLDGEKFDGVLVDLQMPHLNGFGLAKRARGSRSNSQIPIVMLTAFDDVETRREAFRAGVTFFLRKPFTQEEIQNLFRAARGALLREKRRCARLPFRTKVKCRCGQRYFQSLSLNIAENGMLLEPSGGVDVGQKMELEFVMPYVPRPLKILAEVVRRLAGDRVGVRFTSLASEDRQAVQDYIIGGIKE